MWEPSDPYKFGLKYTVTLFSDTNNDRLECKLDITNKETERSFEFTAALHTYFRVSDIASANISHLEGNSQILSLGTRKTAD
jgi:glucose-6-phosphate 1-epimerase